MAGDRPGSADLSDLAAAEMHWLRTQGPFPGKPGRYGLECYPLAEFARLLALAMAVPGMPAAPVFCDVGAGIGTKVIAAGRAGCIAWGVEAVPEYAAAARDLGADVTCCDAEHQHYASVDVAFQNSPYSDLRAEWRFERWLHRQLPPGAALISVNHMAPPDGWGVVLDEPARSRGIYLKPR